MRIHKLILMILSVTTLMLTACTKSIDNNAPLAFVPSDTPYVFANLDPMPEEVFNHFMTQMQPAFTLYGQSIDRIISDNKSNDTLFNKSIRAIAEEIKARDSLEKWKELGFKENGRGALYGVGLIPVLRMELSNTIELKAAIERIETKIGQKLPTRIIDGREFWQIDIGNPAAAGATNLSDLANLKVASLLPSMQLIFALENNQLVFSVITPDADDTLRKQILGITRPAQNLLESGTLATLSRTRHYTFYSGYIDVRRSVKLITAEQLGNDPLCTTELDAVTAHFPRLTVGYTGLTSQHMATSAMLEMDQTLAKDLMTTIAPVPGMENNDDALLDFGLSLSLLKMKEFWLKQAQAVADKPFQCHQLAYVNDSFAKLQQQLNQTAPPPLSDLLGARFVLSRLAFKAKAQPEFAGKALIAINNPNLLIGMAQLTVPALRDFKLVANSEPVAIPTGILPVAFAPAFAAMNEHAIALSIGQGEESGLNAFLNAPPAKTPTFLHMGFNGALYQVFVEAIDQFSALSPEKDPQEIEMQKQVMRIYSKIFKRSDVRVTLSADGIELSQSVQMN